METCTDLEERNGYLTGRYVRPVCYGRGKVTLAARFAHAHGADLRHSFFYTDSYSDLPMLLRVGEPRVVNPDLRLGLLARRKGWPVERWRAS